jgi:precorrin-4 methylase
MHASSNIVQLIKSKIMKSARSTYIATWPDYKPVENALESLKWIVHLRSLEVDAMIILSRSYKNKL